MAAIHRAYRRFLAIPRDAASGIVIGLSVGDMVVFDNRRNLQEREAIDPSTGVRHPDGCNVDRGDRDSRMRVLVWSHG